MSQNRLATLRLVAVSSLGMLACAGLGAFGGCNLGLVEIARGGAQNQSKMLLLGLVVGLLVGLAASFWDRSQSTQPSPVRRRFALRFSYAAAWLLVAALSFRGDWTKAHNWTPVNIPLRFDNKDTVSATFTADASDTYLVQIDLKRNLPFEDLNAFVGGWIDSDKPPHPGPPRPEIVWTVTNVPEANRSTYWQGEYWGGTVGLQIGEFKAVKGQRYTVTVQVVKPSPSVQVLDPQLQVALTPRLKPPYYSAAGSAGVGGIIAGGIGLILLFRSVVTLRREQATQSEAPPSGNAE